MIASHGMIDSSAIVEFCERRVPASFHGEVARAEQGGTIQAQNVPRVNSVHMERKTKRVAFRQKIWESVNVSGNVMWFLCAKARKKLL